MTIPRGYCNASIPSYLCSLILDSNHSIIASAIAIKRKLANCNTVRRDLCDVVAELSSSKRRLQGSCSW